MDGLPLNPRKMLDFHFFRGGKPMFWLLAGAFSAIGVVQAAPLNKCVAENGHVTFTQQACPGGMPGEAVTVRSASGGMTLGPTHQPDPLQTPAEKKGGVKEVTVVGSGSAKCGGGSEQEARTAIVKREIYVGMTAEQATKAWGMPSEINRSSDGTAQWVYDRGNAVMDFLYVDQAGCISAWN